MERRCFANKQYFKKECLQILYIPARVAGNGLESNIKDSRHKIKSS